MELYEPKLMKILEGMAVCVTLLYMSLVFSDVSQIKQGAISCSLSLFLALFPRLVFPFQASAHTQIGLESRARLYLCYSRFACEHSLPISLVEGWSV